MNYKVYIKNKTHIIQCDNIRNLHAHVAAVLPELNKYQNFRYSVYPLAVGNEIKYIVNLITRQDNYEALMFEKVRISSPATSYTRVSPIFENFQDAVHCFQQLCTEFERHTNVSLIQKSSEIDMPRRTTKKKEIF